MSAAIKLENAQNVYVGNVQTDGFENGIIANNSSGVIEGYQGDPISLRNNSEFQIVQSKTSGLEVSNSVVEVYDGIAMEILKITPGDDPVLNDLQYYAERVIDCRQQSGKEKLVSKIKNKFAENRIYLDILGYGHSIYQILKPVLT